MSSSTMCRQFRKGNVNIGKNWIFPEFYGEKRKRYGQERKRLFQDPTLFIENTGQLVYTSLQKHLLNLIFY